MTDFAFANLITAATIAGSTTLGVTGWPATNTQLFGRPHIRAYSADLTGCRITYDFGTTTALGFVALFHPNFLTVTIQGHGSDAWGAPDYTSGLLTMGYAGNDRVHHIHRPTALAPFSKRFLSLSIPAQATTDGATVFKLGSVWAGALVAAPRDLLIPHTDTKVAAREDVKTGDGRTLNRLILDDPAFRVQAKFKAADDTELAAWRAIGRQWDAAPGQAALVHWIDAYLNHVYLMRRVNDEEWPNAAVWSEATFDCVEITAG